MRRYQLVDFAAQFQKGFRNHVAPVANVPDLMRAYEHFECYATYFLFSPEILTYMELHPIDGRPSVSGFDGKIWAPYLPIDIDSEDLDRALVNARRMAEFLFMRKGLSAEACPVYFSGAKGFHFMLDTRALGRIIPSLHLHLVFSHFRKELIYEVSGLNQDVFDLTIKDKVRLLRLPNTVNQKTNLYKIQLLPEELFQLSISEIKEKASEARELYFTDETGLAAKTKSIRAHLELEKIFRRSSRIIHRLTRKPFHYFIKAKHGTDPEKFLCPGFLEMWHSHIPAGERNNSAIRLLSEFRRNGLSEEEARDLILDWNSRNSIGLSDRELAATLKSAYSRAYPYHFGCHDQIIHSFCPLKDTRKCDAWVKNREPGSGFCDP
ncbi:MAG: primase C-terminal domain-containing protein [Candidatus Omnitrophica bacterium]|nr:primase C-terminal domain-containing protein [Candidatus Omnitrophota bacterium]